MLVNFEDNTGQPYTAAFTRDLVFGRVGDFFLENSQGRAWLAGDVVGWFTLPISATVCDLPTMTALAGEAAGECGRRSDSILSLLVRVSGPLLWCGGFFDGLDEGVCRRLFAVLRGGARAGAPFRPWTCRCQPLRWRPSPRKPVQIRRACRSVQRTALGVEGQLNAFHKESLGWLNYGTDPQ